MSALLARFIRTKLISFMNIFLLFGGLIVFNLQGSAMAIVSSPSGMDSIVDPTISFESFSTSNKIEELSILALRDILSSEDSLYIAGLRQDEIDELNALIRESVIEVGDFFYVSDRDEEILIAFAPQFPYTDGCETILNYRIQNYSYHLPYTYWYKDEGWYDDMMLEYAHWTNDGRKRSKAFYINNNGLFQAVKNCGIAVYWEAMEGRKQRVTAVVGWSVWWWHGPYTVSNSTYLGFAP